MAAPIAVGVLLNQFFDRVDQTIDAAKNAGLKLEMEAGFQLRQTIEKTKVAYAEVMHETMDRVDQTVIRTMGDIENLVLEVERRNAATMQAVASRAQQIANTLPFHNDRPQVASYTPSYVLRGIGDQTPIRVKVYGNFEHASQQGYEPHIVCNGQQIPAQASTTQSLEFELLPQQLFARLPDHTVTYRDVELQVPWKTTWLGINQRVVTVFKLAIGALPLSPGSITLNYTLYKTVRKEKNKSQQFHLCSRKCCGNDDHKDEQFELYPDLDWKIKSGSAQVKEIRGAGRRGGPHFVNDQDNRIVAKATTIKNTIDRGGAESGWMDFEISCKQWKDEIEPESHEEVLELEWGEKRVFNYPIGQWKITFIDFENIKTEFQGPDNTSSPYIRIKNEGTGFAVIVPRPKELRDI